MTTYKEAPKKPKTAKPYMMPVLTAFVFMIACVCLTAPVSAEVDINATLSPILGQITEIIPSLIDLIVGLVPAIIVMSLVAFVIGFLDKILKMMTLK